MCLLSVLISLLTFASYWIVSFFLFRLNFGLCFLFNWFTFPFQFFWPLPHINLFSSTILWLPLPLQFHCILFSRYSLLVPRWLLFLSCILLNFSFYGNRYLFLIILLQSTIAIVIIILIDSKRRNKKQESLTLKLISNLFLLFFVTMATTLLSYKVLSSASDFLMKCLSQDSIMPLMRSTALTNMILISILSLTMLDNTGLK